MKRWLGRWIIVVSVIHTIYAPLTYGDVLASMLAQGVFNTVGSDPVRAEAAWFVLCGAAFLIIGLAVDHVEQAGSAGAPKSIGWSLLLFGVLGAVLMPDGGFWLFLPPALAVLARRSKAAFAAPTA